MDSKSKAIVDDKILSELYIDQFSDVYNNEITETETTSSDKWSQVCPTFASNSKLNNTDKVFHIKPIIIPIMN
jgi:GTP-sensing pleiotropic transcriptional regulator CodY